LVVVILPTPREKGRPATALQPPRIVADRRLGRWAAHRADRHQRADTINRRGVYRFGSLVWCGCVGVEGRWSALPQPTARTGWSHPVHVHARVCVRI